MADLATGPSADRPTSAGRWRRSLHDMTLRSPLMLWRHGIAPGDRLLLVPQGLRTVDPSFFTELESGCIGLAGSAAPYAGGSPFAVTPPGPAWEHALHGFTWLSHLRAAEAAEARDLAERWIADWFKRFGKPGGPHWTAEQTSRRLISMLGGAGFVLNEADPKFHDAYVASVNAHLRHLALTYATAPEGMRRLFILTAIMYGGLCIADQEPLLKNFIPPFEEELKRQVLPDGSSVSRETTSIVEIVLDLLPLDRCFTARNIPVPQALTDALQRALRFVDHMRLGDGMLARFNGVGPTWPDRIAAILAYRDVQTPAIEEARYSGYARMRRGRSIMIMDVGVPPPFDMSVAAHAGCLSFEFSSGTSPLIVNCGAPGPADADWGPLGRGTAAHSTLVLNDTSSSVLVRNPTEEARLGGIPIEGPERVDRVARDEADGAATVTAWHDGYVSRFGMRHERIMRLAADGNVLDGIDRLAGGGRMFAGRGKEVQPFAVRFHLHPRARVRRGASERLVEIRLANGEIWEFSSPDADINLEESVFLAELSGPLQSIQLVLRGTVTERSELAWRVRRMDGGPEVGVDIRDSLRVVASSAGPDEERDDGEPEADDTDDVDDATGAGWTPEPDTASDADKT